MNILDRYFLRSFFRPLLLCLMAFLLCMLVYDLYDNMHDFVHAEVPLRKIFQYYLILFPAWIVDVMPMTLLLSLLYVLSDMSKHGELTAMRACGLSFDRLMAPYFFVGIMFSLWMLWLNLAWVPYARYESKEVFEKTVNLNKTQNQTMETFDVSYRDVAGNRFWYISILYPKDQTATGIEIIQSDEQQHDLKRISASSGVYNRYWTFSNVIVYDYTLPPENPESLKQLPSLDLPEFTESPQQMNAKFKKTKRMNTSELLQALHYSSRLSKKQRGMYSSELHSRIAFPMANLVVFLIGIPFGIVRQRRSGFLAIVNALGFFFIYMILMQILFVLGQNGRIPGWFAAWTPNMISMIIGLGLIRMVR